MALRIGITGGGSGGHFYPLIAVVEELREISKIQKEHIEIRYFGSAGEYADLFSEQQVSIASVMSSKMRRYFSPLNFIDGIKFVLGLFQALLKLLFFMPDILFSKGGPGSLAVVLAAKFYRIPIIIHESDAVPGRTNISSSKFADRVAVSFPSAVEYFNQKGATNVALTGNPVRRDLLDNVIPQSEAKMKLGFDQSKPLLLILGGSQGAVRINEFIVKNLPEITQSFQVMHQTGYGQFEGVQKLTAGQQNYKAVPYLDAELKIALSAADIVVARAGSGTIFEIAAFGKPSILIPIPEAIVGAHQKMNAYGYADTGAADVIEEENLLISIFMDQAKKIIENENIRTAMSENAKKFYHPDADRKIAEEILLLGQ